MLGFERACAGLGLVGAARARATAPGYGFGAEDEAFIDRLAEFQADTPENGYLGVLLQLGVVGAGALRVLAAAIALRA